MVHTRGRDRPRREKVTNLVARHGRGDLDPHGAAEGGILQVDDAALEALLLGRGRVRERERALEEAREVLVGEGYAQLEAEDAQQQELGRDERGAQGVVERGGEGERWGGGGVVVEGVGGDEEFAEAPGGFGGFCGEGEGGEGEGLWGGRAVPWGEGEKGMSAWFLAWG